MGKMILAVLYPVLWLLMKVFFPWRVVGRERIPEGGVLMCANHTSFLDPLLGLCAMTRKYFPHILAKAELMKVPLLGFLMRRVGMIGVHRGKSDVTAFKESLKVLRGGERLFMFPEGTRVREGEVSRPHTGAAVLAARASVPLLPIYIGSRKRLFHKTLVVFGEPYSLDYAGRKPTPEESQHIVDDLMGRIRALGESV